MIEPRSTSADLLDNAGRVSASRPNYALAVLLALAAAFLFSVTSGLSRALVAQYSVIQIIWGQYGFILVVTFATRFRLPLRSFSSGNLRLFLLARAMLPLLAAACLITAFRFVPLGQAVATTFVSPLIVMVISRAFLSERVHGHSWLAGVGGLVGVLIVLRPAEGSLHWAAMLPIGAGLCLAGYSVVTRLLSGRVDTSEALFYSGIVGTIMTSACLPFVWRSPSLDDWVLILGSGLSYLLSHFLWTRALMIAPAQIVEPTTYLKIIWASIIGFIVFDEAPDLQFSVGAAIIIFSGLYLFLCQVPLTRTR